MTGSDCIGMFVFILFFCLFFSVQMHQLVCVFVSRVIGVLCSLCLCGNLWGSSVSLWLQHAHCPWRWHLIERESSAAPSPGSRVNKWLSWGPWKCTLKLEWGSESLAAKITLSRLPRSRLSRKMSHFDQGKSCKQLEFHEYLYVNQFQINLQTRKFWNRPSRLIRIHQLIACFQLCGKYCTGMFVAW